MTPRLFEWWPLLREPGTVRVDLLAGLTGAIVVLPQGIAFATLAGLPPQYGLYAAMVPCLIAALFGSSRQMVTGPANAISLTTLALLAPLAEPGTTAFILLAITLSFLTGATQLLLGLARAGRLVDRVPHSVIVGFTAGAAILIILAQIPAFLGLSLGRGLSFAQTAQALWQEAGAIDARAVLAGLATLVAIRLFAPWNRWVPAMLVGVVVGSLVAAASSAFPGFAGLSDLSGRAPLAAVPPLPGALPPFSIPDLSFETVRTLIAATAVMTLLGLTEATAIARAVAARGGYRLDGNREFVGQGLANLAGSFFSAYPSSGSFNRSGVNVAAGARTPLAAASAAVWLVVLLLFVAPWAKYLPLAVIAGLLFRVAWGLIDFREMGRLWREHPEERAPLLVTFAGTLTLSLEWAILLGLAAAPVSVWLMRRFRRSP